MELSNRAEEVLEALWKAVKEEGQEGLALADLDSFARDGTLAELEEPGLVRVQEAVLRLAEAGEAEARGTVRRHRLAERLLADVLDVPLTQLEEPACRFEHLLVRGIEERVCALLGHPQRCPHGRLIPAGPCCGAAGEVGDLRLVCCLGDLLPGQGGRIAYLQAEDPRRMQKLVALGLLPGTPIRLLERSPAKVFQAGYSQFAVDAELASAIYVRLDNAAEGPGASGPLPGRSQAAACLRRRVLRSLWKYTLPQRAD
jgi:DtxR family Mn-dependent transcriptional regulator